VQLKVSVIIPAYNAAMTIRQAVESALAQNYEKEIIVVNDGSTDLTGEMLHGYGTRIRLIEQANRGETAARNTAIAAARGEYLAFLDSDDYWLPNRIALTVDALDSDAEAGLALCDFRIIDRETGAILGHTHPGSVPRKEDFFESWPLMTPTAVTMRTDLARECGGFPKGVPWGGDTLLWVAAIQRRPFAYVPQVLAVYRSNASLTERRYPARQRKPFEREVTGLYGRDGWKLVNVARDQYASLLLASSLTDLKNGHKLRGLKDLAALLSYRPSYLARVLPRVRTS
jgi:glycosyltransferase involved in cell wall biosynthesis